MGNRRQIVRNKEELKSLCRTYTTAAVDVLNGIMTCADAPEASRVNAASTLIEYGWGKPDEQHNHEHNVNVKYVLESVPDEQWATEFSPKRITNGSSNGGAH